MTRHDSPQGSRSQPDAKPSVPLEKMIDEHPGEARTEASDRLASEAAKAPSPEIEAPGEAYPEPGDSVADLVDNPRRQRS